jgi:hypothetical protein
VELKLRNYWPMPITLVRCFKRPNNYLKILSNHFLV